MEVPLLDFPMLIPKGNNYSFKISLSFKTYFSILSWISCFSFSAFPLIFELPGIGLNIIPL